MTRFGRTATGEPVDAVTLSAHGLCVTLLSYGAIVHSVRLDGVPHDLTVSAQTLSEFETMRPYHGALIGPVANRIRNGTAQVAGRPYVFDRNQEGRHTLHGGSAGTHSKMWKFDQISEDRANLSLDMPDGLGGFPANRKIKAAFEILEGPTLRLTLTTQTDAPSIANMTNHSYWNLDGSGHMRDHRLQILADHYLPTDADTIPTGDIAEVAGTPYDMRETRALVGGVPPLDTTYCLAMGRRTLTKVLSLSGASGVRMTMSTTEPGVLIYDGRPDYDAIAIETQGWPDAPNHPDFPDITVTPDAPVVQITQWHFSR